MRAAEVERETRGSWVDKEGRLRPRTGWVQGKMGAVHTGSSTPPWGARQDPATVPSDKEDREEQLANEFVLSLLI